MIGWCLRLLGFQGDITVGQLADLVGTVGGPHASSVVDAEIHNVYTWHHARGVTGIQLAFTTAVIGVVGAVAKDATKLTTDVAIGLAVVALGIAVWVLRSLNKLHVEYAAALRLGRRLNDLHAEDVPCSPEFRDKTMVEFMEMKPADVDKFLRDRDKPAQRDP